jgi:hypothetical protein
MRQVVFRELGKGNRRPAGKRRVNRAAEPTGFGGMLAMLGLASTKLQQSRPRGKR